MCLIHYKDCWFLIKQCGINVLHFLSLINTDQTIIYEVFLSLVTTLINFYENEHYIDYSDSMPKGIRTPYQASNGLIAYFATVVSLSFWNRQIYAWIQLLVLTSFIDRDKHISLYADLLVSITIGHLFLTRNRNGDHKIIKVSLKRLQGV